MVSFIPEELPPRRHRTNGVIPHLSAAARIDAPDQFPFIRRCCDLRCGRLHDPPQDDLQTINTRLLTLISSRVHCVPCRLNQHFNPPSLIDGSDLYTSGRPKRSTLFPICRKSMTTRKEGRVKRRSRAWQEHSFHFTAVSACNGEIAPESVSLFVRPSECPLSASLSSVSKQ